MAPMGRWGPYAFPLVGEKGEVYVVDGRRIWVFVLGSWQEAARLPEEVRTGTFWKGDTLLLGGLNGAYWGASPRTAMVRLTRYRLGLPLLGEGARATPAQRFGMHMDRLQSRASFCRTLDRYLYRSYREGGDLSGGKIAYMFGPKAAFSPLCGAAGPK